MAAVSGLPFSSLALIVAVVLFYFLCLAVYRLFLHPLAQVPGPKLAALTAGYEAYYDCFKNGGGQFAFKIRELHDRYGTAASPVSAASEKKY